MPTGKVLAFPRSVPIRSVSAAVDRQAKAPTVAVLHRAYVPPLPSTREADDEAHELFLNEVRDVVAVIAMLALGLGIVAVLL